MFVYFMATDSYTKIGITNNLKSRINQVQTGCPIMIFKVDYIELIKKSENNINREINKKIKTICMENEAELTYQQKEIQKTISLIEEKENQSDFIGILNLKKEIIKNNVSKTKSQKRIKKEVDNIYLKYGL